MKIISQLFLGLITALGSSLLVLAAISLSLAEGGRPVAVVPLLPSPTERIVSATPAGALTIQPTAARTIVHTATQSQPTLCPAPDGWEAYTVLSGDTLEGLAQQTGQTPEQILRANCLLSQSLLPGTLLYLPHVEPTFTVSPESPTAVPCGPPPGWVRYTVKPNDTLFQLSQMFGVSVYRLQIANCMSGTLIRAGTRLYVPNVPTRTPRFTSTVTVTATPPITSTSTPPEITVTPETPVVTVTVPPTITFTITPTETSSPTPTMTGTSTATVTLTVTATPAATTTATPTSTPTPTQMGNPQPDEPPSE